MVLASAAESQGLSKRGVAYIRVSAVMGRGDDLISPDIQLDRINAYAARHGIEVVAEIADIDKSGRSFTKRRVGEVIEGIRDGRWQYVLLWKWSRWGRNTRDSLMHLGAVEQAGGIVQAVTEDVDPTTAMGKYNRGHLLLLAELHSDQISEGWREAHSMRRKAGLPLHGGPRFGYVYEQKRYVPDPSTAPILVDAYKRYVGGESCRSLAGDWNARGLRTTRGTRWTSAKLGIMLDTGFAAGLIREKSDVVGPTDKGRKPRGSGIRHFDIWRRGAHEALISPELWEQYKARRLVQAVMPARARTAVYGLSGLLVCSECGKRLHAQQKHNGPLRWVCTSAEKYEGTHAYNSVADERAMQVVLAWVVEMAEGGGQMQELARQFAQAQQSAGEVESAQAEVDRLQALLDRLLDQLTFGRVTNAEYDQQKPKVAAMLQRALAERDEARAARGPLDFEGRIAAFASLRDNWSQLSPGDCRELLLKVLSQVSVRPGPWGPGKVTPVGRWQ